MRIAAAKSKVIVSVFCLLILSGCRQENTSIIIQKNTTSGPQNIFKKITCDISQDGFDDTILVDTVLKVNGTYDFKITIEYSLGGKLQKKIIHSEDSTGALFLGVNSTANWLSIRYSESNFTEHLYEVSFDSKKNQFFLRRYYHTEPKHHISKKYEIFDQGSLVVESEAIKICKFDYNNLVISDALKSNGKNPNQCIEVPYSYDGSTLNAIERILNEVKLEPIGRIVKK